jgi:mannobiose 2-epimerase
MIEEQISSLKETAFYELTEHILPFWMQRMVDMEQGGFYGRMNGKNQIIADAPKGGILNARILWTFSAAFNLLKDPQYRKIADYSADYIFSHFTDILNGGTWWSVKYDGEPLDTKKQVYSQAFFIYAMVEYYIASGKKEALSLAVNLFRLIEQYSFDQQKNGYFEAFDKNWQILDDLRLSEKDANEKKTMNTHLHILEAYTNLFRIWKDPLLKVKLHNLIRLFLDRFIHPQTSHLILFFDEDWVSKHDLTSYGHDIECAWLLHEAALVLDDDDLTKEVEKRCLLIADSVTEGLQDDGSLVYERNNSTGHIDFDRHWWPQSEAVVGWINAWELSADETYLLKACKTFEYIREQLVDPLDGEWYWSIKADGSVNRKDDKAGFWKCPYHNSRMCMEVIRRAG